MPTVARKNSRPPSFDRKLTAYTLAATAVVAVPHLMKADGITFAGNVNQTVSYSATTGAVSGSAVASLPGTGQDLTFTATPDGTSVSGGSGVAFLQDSTQFFSNPAALVAGTVIDPTQDVNFSTSGKLAGTGPLKGNFPLNGEAYLGFYFTEADGVHAGWADLSSVSTAQGAGESYALTLNSYAFANDPNASILAGQTSTGAGTAVTPEPASISLIAMGAAGIAELRRRRQKYAKAA